MKSTIQLQQDPLSCTWESFIETGSNAQQDELTQRLNQKTIIGFIYDYLYLRHNGRA